MMYILSSICYCAVIDTIKFLGEGDNKFNNSRNLVSTVWGEAKDSYTAIDV